LCKLNVLEGT